ncbi:complement component C8 gamma chain-like [Pristis pectinata]|uniref:complement component C8 gamma chain-like n=1 Tax=Pristis pectinata TaxID=685728 RepID=UPI00223E595D|nr:complement component C8 gamma chain-like [Pristis pectinata]
MASSVGRDYKQPPGRRQSPAAHRPPSGSPHPPPVAGPHGRGRERLAGARRRGRGPRVGAALPGLAVAVAAAAGGWGGWRLFRRRGFRLRKGSGSLPPSVRTGPASQPLRDRRARESRGRGARRRAQDPTPIDKIQPQHNFNIQQFTGVWRLIAIGSQCSYLRKSNYRLDAVTVRVSDQTEAMRINTLHKMDGICWDIKQDYRKATTPGRFSRKNRGLTTDIVVSDTDYTNYAILFLQQRRKITLKLYGRTSNIDEAVQIKFRQLVISNNIPEIFIYAFPQYGFCDAADEFHQLDDDLGKS